MFPDLHKSARLAAFGTTTVDLDITPPGEYSGVCGMKMLHGMFIAEAPTSGQAPTDAADAADAVRATARADGVGPRLDANPGRERAVYALPGALCNLPTDVARAGAEQQALPKKV